MNRSELEMKHQQEWVEFEILRSEAWQQIENFKETIDATFGEDKIPVSIYETIKMDSQNWEKQWGTKGEKEWQLRDMQEKERLFFKLGINEGDTTKIRQARHSYWNLYSHD